jgi:MFS family permease
MRNEDIRTESVFPRWSSRLILLAFSILLTVVLLPAFLDHYQFSTSKFAVGHDASQQLPPLISWLEDELVVGEYIREYYLAWMPPLTKGYYLLMSKLGIGVIDASIALQYGAFLVTAIFGWLIGARLGGLLCALGTVGIIVSSNMLYSFVGGIPRTFAFPILMAILWAVTTQRFIATCVLTIVSVACYPVASVIGGMTLTIWVLAETFKPGSKRPQNVRLKWLALVIAGILTVSLQLFQSEIVKSKFGPLIQKSEYGVYPEAGPEGRSWTRRNLHAVSHFDRLLLVIDTTLISKARFAPLHNTEIALFLVLLIAVLFTAIDSAVARPILYFVSASTLAYVLAELVDPSLYFSHRYAYYALPIVFVVTVPYVLFRLSQVLWPNSERNRGLTLGQTTVFVALLATLLGTTGGPPERMLGYFKPEVEEIQLLEHVASFPESSKIAIWPTSHEAISIPLVARRSVLFNLKFHQAFHRDYTLEMRCRASHFFDAYFNPSSSNILRLRDQHKVTHIIFDTRHFEDPDSISYFEPFRTQIAELREESKIHPPEKNPERLGYQFGRYQILPLMQANSGRSRNRSSIKSCAKDDTSLPKL